MLARQSSSNLTTIYNVLRLKYPTTNKSTAIQIAKGLEHEFHIESEKIFFKTHESPVVDMEEQLSEEEKELLSAFRKMNLEMKEDFLKFLRKFLVVGRQ